MLYMWGFERVGVVAADMFFVDPNPTPGEEGAEHGVRVEVRLLDRPPLSGSIYAAQPVVIDRPVWRADLFESVEGRAGSHDRTHHHPRIRGWEPGTRQYEPDMTSDPTGWLTKRLSNLGQLIHEAELDPETIGPDEARQMAEAAGEIASKVEGLLAGVRAGELGKPPAEGYEAGARSGWL